MAKELIEEIIFIVIHEGGVVIYVYPPQEEEKYLLSSLISAIFAIMDGVSSRENEVVQVSSKDKEMFAMKKGDIIYALFIPKESKINGNKLLLSFFKILNESFPAEIVDGLVKVRTDTRDIDLKIANMLRDHVEKIEEKELLPLSDAVKILGIEKSAFLCRCLLARKNIVICGYDRRSIRKIVRSILYWWPKKIGICDDISEVPNDRPLVFVLGKEDVDKIKSMGRDIVLLNLDKKLEEKIGKDYILVNLREVLHLKSEESISIKFKQEITALDAIVKSIEEITSKLEGITISELKKKLQEKYPKKKIDYVLDILVKEKSSLLKKIRTINKTLEEIFF